MWLMIYRRKDAPNHSTDELKAMVEAAGGEWLPHDGSYLVARLTLAEHPWRLTFDFDGDGVLQYAKVSADSPDSVYNSEVSWRLMTLLPGWQLFCDWNSEPKMLDLSWHRRSDS